MRAWRQSNISECRTWRDFEVVRISRHERAARTYYNAGRWDQGQDSSLLCHPLVLQLLPYQPILRERQHRERASCRAAFFDHLVSRKAKRSALVEQEPVHNQSELAGAAENAIRPVALGRNYEQSGIRQSSYKLVPVGKIGVFTVWR
jgi:hypothetical protein